MDISQSAEYLEETLKHTRSASQKQRLQMLWWLKTGQVRSHSGLARILAGDALPPVKMKIERFWLFVKSQIKGQIFKSLDELRDRLNQIFHQITSERVMSLTSYDFILEALFYAASSRW
ncbi:MAG: hypothetical protein RMY28_037950 [Nostoc sp. ChiSLP01]|nr:hypothetical protein [Nostoc sp. ChiSLP01]